MQEVSDNSLIDVTEEPPQVFHPWRRYFARMLDMSIYSILWAVFLAFVLNINVIARTGWANVLDTFVALLIMLFIEPLLLSIFATTPGKAIFGLKVTERVRKLSYSEGLERTWMILGKGYGYNIPIYNIVRLWKSYKLCKENEVQPWDDYTRYTIKDTKWFRPLAYIAAFAVSVAILISIAFAQLLPPNRGNITIEQFVENHNYYARHFGIEFGGRQLDRNGRWIRVEDNIFWVNIFESNSPPEFRFVLDANGYVREIFFEIEYHDRTQIWLGSYEQHIFIATLAFVGAQNEVGLFSGTYSRLSNQIAGNLAWGREFTEAGVTIAWEVERSGFQAASGASFLWTNENAEGTYFSLRFSMGR